MRIPYLREAALAAALAAAALALWWSYSWAFDRGYDSRDAQLVEETAERQARVDRLGAQNDALQRALSIASRARTDLERRLADEAAQDPLGRDPGLGADSLRRLNQIR